MTEKDITNPHWQIPTQNAAIQVHYEYDEKEGKIIHNVNKHDEAGHLILQQAWDTYYERAEEARKLVQAGLKSPIYYHMERIGMELNVLAPSVDLSQWRVKRHLKPTIYKKLKKSMLEKYANAFEIKLEELDKID